MKSPLWLCGLTKTRLAAVLLTGLLGLCTAATTWAQPGGGGRGGFMQEGQQRIEALRVSFITNELKLTPDEAKTFWPVYEAREAELKKARRDMMVERFEVSMNFDSMTDADLDKAMESMLELQTAEANINKRYHIEFKKLLGIRRTALFYRAEQRFKRELLRRLSQRPGGAGAIDR